MSLSPKILWTDKIPTEVLKIAKNLLPSGFTLLSLEEYSKDCLLESVKDVDYFFVTGHKKIIDSKVLNAATKLKMIQKSGKGYENLDLNLFKKRNIPTYRTVKANTVSCAEHTLLLILAALRRISLADSQLRKGNWLEWELRTGNSELNGKTVGLIGLGNIGTEVAKRLASFNVKIILYYKRNRLPKETEEALGVTYCNLSQLLREGDIISLHLPLSAKTRNFIGRKEIASMKKGVVLINIARGEIIDEEALIEALKSGHIKAAGLDVFQEEPIKKAHPLFDLDNVILTPHMASGTIESLTRTLSNAFTNISLFEAGQEPPLEDRLV